MWMKEHKDELMDQGLLENDDELWATEKEGQWPGHAAIVALANLLKVNIAVIQGNFYHSEKRVREGNVFSRVFVCLSTSRRGFPYN